MSVLTPEHRAQLLQDSRETAAAFMEDIPFLRGAISHRVPKRADLRLASGVLRRLLIDGDLQTVAAPRIGKVELRQFNNSVFHEAAKRRRVEFFASGGIYINGVAFRAMTAWRRFTTPEESRQIFEEERKVSPAPLLQYE